ncbi:MAG: hypothetical protein ABSE82_13035 [Nitrososphaerales archaeon]|jgi:DNA-binding MarR family transcriptional regulator
MSGTPSGSSQPSEEERRLTPLQTKVLYHLYRRKKFKGSIIGLSKDMGYSSDGKVNPAVRYLVQNGYADEEADETGRTYTLTRKGEEEIAFITLSDKLVTAIFAVGMVNVVVAYLYFVLGIPISPYSIFVLGVGMVVLAFVLVRLKRGMVKRFLDLREPLTD